mgnify:CR=1 FL=1
MATLGIGHNIDQALGSFVDCLQMASKCMVKKFNVETKNKHASWFDRDCREAKKRTRAKLSVQKN